MFVFHHHLYTKKPVINRFWDYQTAPISRNYVHVCQINNNRVYRLEDPIMYLQ